MVQVANLAALRSADDGDYIQQTVRGENLRLYRRGVDQKGNLITESEHIPPLSDRIERLERHRPIGGWGTNPENPVVPVETTRAGSTLDGVALSGGAVQATITSNPVGDWHYQVRSKGVWGAITALTPNGTAQEARLLSIGSRPHDGFRFWDPGGASPLTDLANAVLIYEWVNSSEAGQASQVDEKGIDRVAGDPILLYRLNQLIADGETYPLPAGEKGDWFSVVIPLGQTALVGITTYGPAQHIVTFWNDGSGWLNNSFNQSYQWDSLNERDSGDRFFDGEIIYHRDIRGTTLIDNQDLGVGDVDHLLHVTGFARAPSGDEIHPGFFDGDNRIGIYRAKTGELRVRTSWPVASYAFHLRYTKTVAP